VHASLRPLVECSAVRADVEETLEGIGIDRHLAVTLGSVVIQLADYFRPDLESCMGRVESNLCP